MLFEMVADCFRCKEKQIPRQRAKGVFLQGKPPFAGENQ